MFKAFGLGSKTAGAGIGLPLKKRVAVVTGSGRGIGAAIALALATAGARVVVSSEDAEACGKVAREIAEAGGESAPIPCNVCEEGQVKALIEGAAERFGSIDIMVNNAGIDDLEPILTTDTGLWRRMLAVNLDGAFFGTKYAALRMKDGKWGRIINISSVAGLRGFGKRAAYCASKAGVVGLTKAAAVDLGQYGITVNAICPGVTRTRMTEEFLKNKGAVHSFMKRMPIKRAGFPHEIAHAALFLASEDAGYVTGQAIVVDGGWSVQV